MIKTLSNKKITIIDNCANHPEQPAVTNCHYCEKPICSICTHNYNSAPEWKEFDQEIVPLVN